MSALLAFSSKKCPCCYQNKPPENFRQLRTASLTKAANSMLPLSMQLMADQAICDACWDSMIAGMILKAESCRDSRD
jgi:hypothetical protein